MDQEALTFGLPVVGILVGLVVLIGGEAVGRSGLVPVGGVVVLAAVGVLALAISRL